MTVLLELHGIEKSFAHVRVLKRVDFRVHAGRVVALAGENGAGKSTLMKIIGGIYRADGGEMRLRDRVAHLHSPQQAMAAGIAIIHQELNLLPHLGVAENIFLGREPRNRLGLLQHARMRREAAHWLGELQQDLDPAQPLARLSIAQQQMVEIARALSQEADLIIMDEPTDALSDQETALLFAVVERLRAAGKGLVFISHRLGEIFRLCDDIAVLRDGEMVHQGPVSELTEDALIRHMVGRELADQYPYRPGRDGAERLRVTGLSAHGVTDLSFQARAGEVVGFAGLMGAGRTELAKALYGANPASRGEVAIDGESVTIRNPRDGIRAGIGYVTEDRKAEGLIQGQPLVSNMSLTGLGRFLWLRTLVDARRERATVQRYTERFRIRASGLDARVATLSGGNQQKASLAKTLIPEPRIVILDEPTRGVDVGARREIYSLIDELKGAGLCVLLMSSDMPELLGISDRILVLSRGRLTGEFSRAEASQEAIMRCAVQ